MGEDVRLRPPTPPIFHAENSLLGIGDASPWYKSIILAFSVLWRSPTRT